jgi:hypothetical protein
MMQACWIMCGSRLQTTGAQPVWQKPRKGTVNRSSVRDALPRDVLMGSTHRIAVASMKERVML